MNWKEQRYAFRPMEIDEVLPGMKAKLIKEEPWGANSWVIGMTGQIFRVFKVADYRVQLSVPSELLKEIRQLPDEEFERIWDDEDTEYDPHNSDNILCTADVEWLEFSDVLEK